MFSSSFRNQPDLIGQQLINTVKAWSIIELTDEVNLSLFADENAFLALRLLFGRNVNGENCVASTRVIIHLMRSNRSILHSFLQHGEKIVELFAIDEEQILHVKACVVKAKSLGLTTIAHFIIPRIPRNFFDHRTANGFFRAAPGLSKSITYDNKQHWNHPLVVVYGMNISACLCSLTINLHVQAPGV